MPRTRAALRALSSNARPAGNGASSKRKRAAGDENARADLSKRPNFSKSPQSSATVAKGSRALSPTISHAAQVDEGRMMLKFLVDLKMARSVPEMHCLEVWSGSDKDGVIKFFAEGGSQPVLAIKASDIEQVMVMDNIKPDYTSVERAYRVVIIRKTDVGSRGITDLQAKDPDKKYGSHAMFFSWPEKKLSKAIIRATTHKTTDTYLSVFTTAFNVLLEPLDKSVLIATTRLSIVPMQDVFSCAAALEPVERTDVTKMTRGTLHFFPTGLMFVTAKINFYMPVRAFESVLVVIAKEIQRPQGTLKAVGLKLACKTTDAAWPDKNTWTKDYEMFRVEGGRLVPVDTGPIRLPMLAFKSISVDAKGAIRTYLGKLGLPLKECAQLFYNYDADQPMTGFLPGDEED